MGKSLCAGHALVSQCSDMLVARVATEVTLSNLHSLYMLDKGSTSQRIAKYVYEVALRFGRTHDENCVTSEVFIVVALTTVFLFVFLCVSK